MSTPRAGGSAGATRTCPHCRATILESASVCPACRHHLKSGAARTVPRTMTALQVDGILQPPPNNEPWEYSVVISIKNTRGEEVTRQVVGVGALQPNEQRTFTVSVEVTLPQGAVVPVGTGGDVRIAPR